MSSIQQTFAQLITDRNQVLDKAGIHASYVAGCFAREVTESGCHIYISALDVPDSNNIKAKLRKFLDSQPKPKPNPVFPDEPMRA